METSGQYEVRYPDGTVEKAESVWGARHLISRRAAFIANPLDQSGVLPAEIWKVGPGVFGGGAFVDSIEQV